jgi:hypothetical protein
MPERLCQKIDIRPSGWRHAEQACEVDGTVMVRQAKGMLGWKAEALADVVVGDIAVAGHRREPLPGVALLDSRLLREFFTGH